MVDVVRNFDLRHNSGQPALPDVTEVLVGHLQPSPQPEPGALDDCPPDTDIQQHIIQGVSKKTVT